MKGFTTILCLLALLCLLGSTVSACDIFTSCHTPTVSAYGSVGYGSVGYSSFAVQPAYASVPFVQTAVYATPLEVAAPVAVRTFAYSPVSIASYSPTVGVQSFHPVAINRRVAVHRNSVVVVNRNHGFGVNRNVVVNHGFGANNFGVNRNVIVNRNAVINHDINRNVINRNVIVRPGGVRVNGFGSSRVFRGR